MSQAVDFVQQLNMHGFTVSGKSTIIASDMRLACDIQVELAKHNIDIQVAASGRDVGTDFTAGGRRRITIQRTRANAVKRGIATVLKMSCSLKSKRARKLIFTACKPRAWGFSVMGCSPTMAKATQGNAVKGLGIKKFGGCNRMAMATWTRIPGSPSAWIMFCIFLKPGVLPPRTCQWAYKLSGP